MSTSESSVQTLPPVVVRDIRKNFGPVQALKGVSLEVPAHSIFGVIGPNGAGKTTLFSILTGFILPSAGSATVLGTENLERIKGRISILPQDALFQSNIPIIDQLSFFLTLMGWRRDEAEEEVLRVLTLVSLDDVIFRDAATLSHGMYKRLALAQAFLGRPEVIILDEPTSGLDWKSAEAIREAIRRLQQDATVMVSSHDLEEMHDLCDHVAILDRGELVAVGPVEAVTGSVHAVRVTFHMQPDDSLLQALRAVEGVTELVPQDDSWEVLIEPRDGSTEVEADRIVADFLKTAIGLGLYPRSLSQENRLKRVYLDVTK